MNVIVYTTLIGKYDILRATRYPSTCLTDSSMDEVRGWEFQRIPKMHWDARRASRIPKMMPHRYFPTYEYSIYMDGNIQLLRPPADIIFELLDKYDMALFKHPQRGCIYREAKECIKRKKDDPGVIAEQVSRYRDEGFPAGFGLSACWVIVRRNTGPVRTFGEVWWKEYEKGSSRDQLCFDYVRWKLGMEVAEIPGNLFENDCEYFRRSVHA